MTDPITVVAYRKRELFRSIQDEIKAQRQAGRIEGAVAMQREISTGWHTNPEDDESDVWDVEEIIFAIQKTDPEETIRKAFPND